MQPKQIIIANYDYDVSIPQAVIGCMQRLADQLDIPLIKRINTASGNRVHATLYKNGGFEALEKYQYRKR